MEKQRSTLSVSAMSRQTDSHRPFKDQVELDKRKDESARIRRKYPDRIAVIVEQHHRSGLPEVDKKKYLVPAELTIGQFVYVIRKRIKLKPEQSIFLFVGDTLPPTSALVSQIYQSQRDEDGFLYVTYSSESTFGNT